MQFQIVNLVFNFFKYDNCDLTYEIKIYCLNPICIIMLAELIVCSGINTNRIYPHSVSFFSTDILLS
jgi:hypothetical protein